MIDDGIVVEYLKPELWTNLGIVIAPFTRKEHILHILQRWDGSYNGITSNHLRIPLDQFITGNRINIQELFRRHCDIIEVRVYTIQGLVSYYKDIQKSSVYQQDIDDYLIDLYCIQEKTKGIRIYQREEYRNRCYMALLKSFLQCRIEDAVILIWLTDKGRLYFNCILEFSSTKLKRISTSDRYSEVEEEFETIYDLVQKEFQKRIITIKMELAEYIRSGVLYVAEAEKRL